jgi:hypothetical protein
MRRREFIALVGGAAVAWPLPTRAQQSAKVLPTTLAASESDGGLGVKMVFERHIVWPDGHREVEGVTPKALPAPDASHMLPSSSIQG